MKPSEVIVAVVFCRGGSKGLAGKNLRLFDGKPLVARAVEDALGAPSVTRVIVSTDDPAIADAAEAAGAEVPFLRPAELATDEASEILAWRHAVDWLEAAGPGVDIMVSVPATAPLRQIEDVEACIAAVRAPGVDMAVTITRAAHSPWFDMVGLDAAGHVRALGDFPLVHRRQDADAAYLITPICYAARPEWVRRTPSVLSGRIQGVEVPRERAVDIDTEMDLQFAEFLLGRST